MGHFSSVGMMFRCLGGSQVAQGQLFGLKNQSFGHIRDNASDNEKIPKLNGSIASNEDVRSAYEDTKSPVINSAKMR